MDGLCGTQPAKQKKNRSPGAVPGRAGGGMTVKRGWNRVTALLLALALALVMAVPAWAAEESPEVPTGETEPVETTGALWEEADETPEEAGTAQDGEVREESGAEKPLFGLFPQAESNLPDAAEDKDLISAKEAFVPIDKKKTLELKRQPQSEAYFVSKDTRVVSVRKTGSSLVMKGEGVGKTVVEMRRSADDTLLDSVTVYGFRASKISQESGTRYRPGELTVTTGSVKRVYRLTCQKGYDSESYGSTLRHRGCTFCSVTAVCSAYGNYDVSTKWMMGDGWDEIALRSGTTRQEHTLGFYGMQQVLDYAGISSKVYNWKDTEKARSEAKEEMVTALSAGRPVVMFMDKVPNGIMKSKVGVLFGNLHCIPIVGISESGYLLIGNSNYPQGINMFKYKGKAQKLNITPGEMLDYFVRHSSTKRYNNKDFYFAKSGGLHTFLEVTCDEAREVHHKSIVDIGVKLEKSSYTYTGEAFTPKVTIGKLKEDRDFKVTYSDNIKAGTARVTVVGLGDNYGGFQKLKFTIKRAPGEITASDKTLKSKTERQEVKLGASARGGAALTYSSSDESVSVSKDGVVTIPAGYVGTVTITISSAQTANVAAATKKVTVTVKADQKLIDQGTLLVSDWEVRYRTGKRNVKLNPVAQEGSVFTYACEEAEVSEDGVVTVPAGYIGVVRVNVTAQLPDGTAQSKTVQIRVRPPRVSSVSVKAAGKDVVNVKWKKSNLVDGFQVQYRCNGKTRTMTLKKGSTTSAKLSGLKKGKTCKVCVRCFAEVNDDTVFSNWSSEHSVKVK